MVNSCSFSGKDAQEVIPCTAVGNLLCEEWAQFHSDMADVTTIHF